MQAQIAKIQEGLANETIEVAVGGAAVTIIVSGDQKVKSVKIDPEAANPEEIELLEDLMVAAFNEAMRRSQELASKRLGGLKIPGLF
ncbi:MAG: YbaB/EbfC family nucleoid-associated protein [Chloroflexi bacterium]|nr:YbaB/EbfC family nucleoid-associated protein [Chloroflexota bacterium]